MIKSPLNVSLSWQENMKFVASTDSTDVQVPIDFAPYSDIHNGVTPKHMFLQAVSGCGAQIVIMMLSKVKASMPTSFRIDVSGNLTKEHPMYFDNIDMHYEFEGDTDKKALQQAVMMSEQMCGLSVMASKSAKINLKVTLNGEELSVTS